jgi:glycosyltransferase involved in cell wall biosynthesis
VHLHHHTVVLSLWGFLAARMTGRPAVITSHVHWGDPSSEQPLGWWLLRHCDAAIAVTQYEADRYASGGVPREKIVISTNAVDIDSFEAASLEKRRVEVRERLCIGRDERVVTFIGRKTLTKDLPVLLEAAQHVARSRGIVLLLLGPRSQEWTPPASVSNGSKLRVIDLPAVPEGAKMAALAASDVVVQPSWREAFGIVFLEAWASGVPPIGAQWGAIPEVIGDAGLTFEKGNALDLASKLDWILDHPHEARDMVARGQERLRNTHTWDCVGRAVEQAYEIARRRHGGPRDIGAKRPPRSESTAGRHPVASSESAHAERRDRR